MALVPFIPTPHFFLEDGNEAAARICRWDPYAALGLPREDVSSLLALASLRGEDAEAAVAARAARVTEAYRTLAAALHPDAQQAGGARKRRQRQREAAGAGPSTAADAPAASSTAARLLYSWLPLEERFAAVAASAAVLRDLSSTLQYHAALEAQDGHEEVSEKTEFDGRGDCWRPSASRVEAARYSLSRMASPDRR